MSVSPLTTKTILAHTGNYTKSRAAYGGKIKKITIHHAAWICQIEDLGRLWQTVGRKGSSTYGVSGTQIGAYVDESDIPWTDGNWDSNLISVTIETANSAGAPNWTVSDTTLATLIKLVADIARRNGLGKLVVGKTLTLTYHSMFANTACPGPFLLGKMQYIADQANAINENYKPEVELMYMSTKPVAMKLGYMSAGDIAGMKVLLQSLQIGFTESNGYLTTIAVSKGDQPAILARAVEMGIDFEPAVTQSGVAQADYDAAVKRAETAEAQTKAAQTKITNAQKALA